ncbi:DNA polymerase III subunit delta [Patescibacteria group bacterium]|nr:DNA polymerase III subunit delta [Patescibacteria group bacterium]MBU1015514.1 DNA polymerase III subunit delta [Patescibacteria group bacterium]MBU1685632.1 DNA polymerase III subunit delta [Patescibacteria group bacterium]MBU1938125.1 DNA polymerase III subunit delta [Patescibacteria group bacterium]
MLKNLFLFTGEETYLLHEQINSWKKAFTEKHGDINLAILDAEDIPLYEIMAAVNAMPFLGDKRLIFIHGLPDKPKTRQTAEPTKKDEKRDEELKKLEADLDEIPESSVVVFVQSNPDKRKSFYKKLSAKAEVKEFIPLTGQILNEWIKKRIQVSGASIDLSTAEYLASLAGQDLWRLSQEIDKLTAYSSGEDITRPIIDRLVVPTLEANVFHLTDALGIKDHRKAIQHLHRSLAAGENLRQVFYMVVRQFRLLLQGSGYKISNPNSNPTAFAATLKLHPFVARNTMAQLKNFSYQELKDAYARLLEIDVALKTSRIRVTTDNQDELALAMERFIISFCS